MSASSLPLLVVVLAMILFLLVIDRNMKDRGGVSLSTKNKVYPQADILDFSDSAGHAPLQDSEYYPLPDILDFSDGTGHAPLQEPEDYDILDNSDSSGHAPLQEPDDYPHGDFLDYSDSPGQAPLQESEYYPRPDILDYSDSTGHVPLQEADDFYLPDFLGDSDSSGHLPLQESEDDQLPDFLYNSDSSGRAPLQEPEELRMWCQLDRLNTIPRLMNHFPHAAQGLLPCWSWFQETIETRSHRLMTTHCGFYLKDGIGRMVRPNGWIEQLITHMGCNVTETEPVGGISTDNCTANCFAKNVTLVHRFPKEVFSTQFFKRPEDAAALRSKILRSLNVTDEPGTSAASARIAIVDRKKSRRIRNVKKMAAAIRATFPSATLEIAYMETMVPSEQFVFWSQHDIVITGHGAAVTSAFFLPPGNTSAVIQIFPPHYYLNMFSYLLSSAGLHDYGYYNGVSDYMEDFAEHSKTIEDRTKYRTQDLKPPLDAVIELVQKAMMEGGFLDVSE